MKPFPKKAKLLPWCLLLSVFTLVVHNLTFFRSWIALSEEDPAGPGIAGAVLFLLAAIFLLYLLLAFLGRTVGKWLIGISLVLSAITLYSVNMYHGLVTDEMVGNTFESRYSELSNYVTRSYVLWVLLTGVVPGLYAALRRVEFGSWKRFLAAGGIALVLCGTVLAANRSKLPWVERHSLELGGLLMPWSWSVHMVGYLRSLGPEEEIPLPDATLENDSPDVCVLFIGESACRDHFSLFGYGRETNPLLAADSVSVLPVWSANTYTIACVRAMLEPFASDTLYEPMPSYLHRAGVDVRWRTSNWGEPPLRIDRYETVSDLKKRFPDASARYDDFLLSGLKEEILGCDSNKLLIVIHSYTNHGPDYRSNYPPEFEHFFPVGDTRQLSKVDPELICNAYDNCIRYSDFLIHSVIDTLRAIPSRRCCLIYMSDHGESLGEGGHFLHAEPLSLAPPEQRRVPLIIWSSDKDLKVKEMAEAEPYCLFHSLLRFYGISSPVFDETKCVFEE